ncbi:hypothetical protein C8R43DRAFT_1047632 [Mycena crocata]|nr:hypothetical protein C8R43DRAFT_1047632 [Mycena crocata]
MTRSAGASFRLVPVLFFAKTSAARTGTAGEECAEQDTEMAGQNRRTTGSACGRPDTKLSPSVDSFRGASP